MELVLGVHGSRAPQALRTPNDANVCVDVEVRVNEFGPRVCRRPTPSHRRRRERRGRRDGQFRTGQSFLSESFLFCA
jgi:hypothetical protein